MVQVHNEDRPFGIGEREAIDNEREGVVAALRSQGDQLLDRQPGVRQIADAINARLEAIFARYLDGLA